MNFKAYRITKIKAAVFIFGMLFTFCAHAVHAQTVTQASGGQLMSNDSVKGDLKEGMVLGSSSEIVTKEGETVDITTDYGSGIRFLPETTGSIDVDESGSVVVDITKGNVLFNIKRIDNGQSFTVRTPVVVASVRGTKFWGRVIPAGQAGDPVTFAVLEGSVELSVAGSNQTVLLQAGDAADIPRAGGLPVLRRALDDELAAIRTANEIATSV